MLNFDAKDFPVGTEVHFKCQMGIVCAYAKTGDDAWVSDRGLLEYTDREVNEDCEDFVFSVVVPSGRWRKP